MTDNINKLHTVIDNFVKIMCTDKENIDQSKIDELYDIVESSQEIPNNLIIAISDISNLELFTKTISEMDITINVKAYKITDFVNIIIIELK